MNTVVVLPNWVGDAVMATPTIRALRERHPRPSRLVGVAHPRVLDVFTGNSWFDRLIPYMKDADDPRHAFVPALRSLRAERPQTAIILPNSFHHAALTLLAGVRERVGYVRRGRGLLLTTRREPPRRDGRFIPCSTLDYYLDLARAAGCTDVTRAMELFTTPDEDAAAESVWADNRWTNADPVVAINNSGAFGAAKKWPIEHAIELASRLSRDTGARVLFLCGPAERDEAAVCATRSGAASLARHGVSIGLTKACIRRCALLITTDSGPRHIGAAFGIPVVTLFGPTDEAWSDTGYARETSIHRPIECRPCQQRECPLGHHQCMQDLSPDDVLSAARTVLERAS